MKITEENVVQQIKNRNEKAIAFIIQTYGGLAKYRAIDHPWVFDVKISTSQLAKETTTFNVDKTVTPISTLVYYDLTKTSEATYFKIVSASGKEWSFKAAFNSNTAGDQSYSRYAPIDMKNETYLLIPYNEHNEKIGPSIPIK